MKANLGHIEKKFDEYNLLIFEGKLPKPRFYISNACTYMGQCVFKRRRKWTGKVENYDYCIRINGRYDLPENEIDDILVHEMIHLLIAASGIRDSSPHGNVFRTLMKGINEKYGRSITISHRLSPENRALETTRRGK